MEKIPSMVDMKQTPAEIKDSVPTISDSPAYPYGLCLRLCQDELEKLGFKPGEFAVNDMIHFHAMAVVTSVSQHDNVNSGPSSTVELQITHMSAESEDEENITEEEEDKPKKNTIAKLYKA